MSLKDLSSNSITKVFEQLSHNETASFMRTAQIFDRVCIENVKIPKREGYMLRIIVAGRRKRLPEVALVGVYWKSHEVRQIQKTRREILRNMISKYHIISYINKYHAVSRKLELNGTHAYVDNELQQMVKETFQKVSTFSVLAICGFTLSNTLIENLKEVASFPLEALIIDKCHSEDWDKYFSVLLDTFKPRNLFMDHSGCPVNLNDLHLTRISDSIDLHGSREFHKRHYPDITDLTLINWSYNTPNNAIVSRGSLVEVVDENDDYKDLNIGSIRSNDHMLRNFVRLQQTRGLTIKLDMSLQGSVNIYYRNIKFQFYYHHKNRRLMLDQARNKLRDVRNQIIEKIGENPVYTLRRDQEMKMKVISLSSRFCDEWVDLQRSVNLLLYVENGNLPDEDDVSSDSEEDD